MNYLLAPIETTSRDYQWKLNAFFDSRPNKVLIIGQADIINSLIFFLPGITYLGKNVIQHGKKKASSLTRKCLKQLSKKNSKLIFIDEEGGLFNLHSNFASTVSLSRHPLHLLPKNTLVCLWGKAQERIISSHYNKKKSTFSAVKILASGHPRFRSLTTNSKSDIVKLMNNRFGKYVLFNTNFSLLTSNNLGNLFSSTIAWRQEIDSINQYLSIYNYESLALSLFLDCLKYTSNNLPQDVSIYLKIHPGESPDLYKFVASHFSNVRLVQQSFIPIHYWILGSCYSVSSRCTTALEATALRQPHISLRPNISSELQCDTPLLQPSCSDVSSFAEFIQQHNYFINSCSVSHSDIDINLSEDSAFVASSQFELNLSDQLQGSQLATSAYEEILHEINSLHSPSYPLILGLVVTLVNSFRFYIIFAFETILRDLLSISKKGSLKFVSLNNSDFLFLASSRDKSKYLSDRFFVVNCFSLVQVIVPQSIMTQLTLRLFPIFTPLFPFVFTIE